MFTLHAHSNYSLLESTISVSDLISFAKNSGSNYVALTDTNSMAGLIQFAKEAEENNIKPVLGSFIDDPAAENMTAIFLAKNNSGYSELCKIITRRKLDESFSLPETVRNVSGNLFVLTSSMELLSKISFTPQIRAQLFVELFVTTNRKNETRKLYEFAKKKKLKIVATHPADFLRKEDYVLHKVVRAIRKNTTLENLAETNLVDEEFYLKTPEELKTIWKALPEAMWNADFIASECNVDLQFGKYKFPAYKLPENETPFSYLAKVAFRGLEERYKPISEMAIKRLQYELEVIGELNFADYFLIVWDILREAKRRNMLTVGRGSAADSLVSYCLGITEVDPIKHNLYFERFLNKGRANPPDIDIDFSWKERDEIIKYVFEKYRYDHVAMISTTVTFRARSAFREVAKTFGIPESEISKFSKFIPWTSARNLPELHKKFPEARSLDFRDEPWQTIIKLASQISGFPRHRSIHPGGIIITPEPITNYVALEYAKNKGLGLIITQPDMYPIEDLGLIKIDLLSQRSLGVLRDTLTMIDSQ